MTKKILLNWIVILFVIIFTGCGSSSKKSTIKYPIVNAGKDKTVIVNVSITLVATVIDKDGSISTYEWKKGDNILGTDLSLTYTPTKVGTDTLTFIATDDGGENTSDEVKITVKEENSLPRIDLPTVSNKSLFKLLEKSERDTIKESISTLSFAYYRDKDKQQWYVSYIDLSKNVDVYSLTPFRDGKNGLGTVGKSVASFDSKAESIKIDDIEDNNEHRYYDEGWKAWNTDPKIQDHISWIREDSVTIEWWFFKATNGWWYIINKVGDVWKFSSKNNDYDWIEIDMGGNKPTFFMDNGIKKVEFTGINNPSSDNPSAPNWDSGFYHHEKDSNGNLLKTNLWYRGFAPRKFYNYSKGEFSELDPCKSTGVEALGNCTWYAKARAREQGGTVSYSSWGNALSFADKAKAQGYTVDKNPIVGDIAQHRRNTYGHVAVVEKVNTDGTIVISESSYAPCISSWNFLYRLRTVKVSEFENYIHVK